jgi:hypothetical protein
MANLGDGGRPRSKSLVRLDLYNAYARLGVSPLMSTDEIKAAVLRKRNELMKRRRTRSRQQFGEEETEITELQAIEEEIGTPRARAKYDQANPQNELLTVQPSPHDRWLDPLRRASLISAWLVEELGRDCLLPSPESLRFWAPRGLDDELTAFLADFVVAAAEPSSPPEGAPEGDGAPPDVAELERFAAPPDGVATEQPSAKERSING